MVADVALVVGVDEVLGGAAEGGEGGDESRRQSVAVLMARKGEVRLAGS